MEKEFFDILIFVPLEEEHDVLMSTFEFKSDLSEGDYIVSELVAPNGDIRIASILLADMGKKVARDATEYALRRFDVGVFVSYGIAGSLNKDNSIGDVCYGGELIDVTNNLSASGVADAEPKLAFSPETYRSDKDLFRATIFLRNHPPTKHHFENWQELCAQNRARFVENLGLSEEECADVPEKVDARASGPIICGPVIKSKKFKEDLKVLNRQMLAVEMESAGIFEAISSRVPDNNVIIIRGICDQADGDKNALEERTKGLARICAAHNAARFLYKQMFSDAFVSSVKQFKNRTLPLEIDKGPDVQSSNYLQAQIIRVSKEIESSLAELSPEYRHKPSGYVLPTPRFSRISLSAVQESERSEAGKEINEVIATHRISWINLKSSYPDDSLPWVIGQHILGAEISGKIAYPIVLDGGQISPPNGSISDLIGPYDISNLVEHHGCLPIVIVAGPNLSTQNRRKFLMQQIESNPDLQFVLVSRESSNLHSGDSVAKKIGAQIYSVDRVSFLELTLFLQKSFELEPQKAEVLASRLNNVFSRFDLNAHPSYFAGIPEATLMAFLQANRRSELIQLAVQGYLTFMVMGDTDDVSLSRTTRQKFLQHLAFDLKVELLKISKAGLVLRAEEFAKKMDYPIDATKFIEGFFSFGFLREEFGHVEFVLPFMESYLLATEMCERPGSDIKYFDFSSRFVDFGTLDLYCEMSVNNGLLDIIKNRIENSSAAISEMYPEGHIMNTHSLDTIGLSWPAHVRRARNAITEAVATVQEGNSAAREKQAALDFTNQVLLQTERHASDVGEKDEAEEIVKERKHWAAFDLMIGCTALSAGAERIEGKTKQDLVAGILKLASNIINGWTRDRSSISVEEIAEDLKRSEEYLEFRNALSTEEKRNRIDNLLDHIAERLQIDILSEATGFVFYVFDEFGRHKVLSKSIEAVNTNNGVEEVLKGCWIADLDTPSGVKLIDAALKKVNPGVFFRVMLSEHILTRVYWDHWNSKDRLLLLNLADEILKPTRITLRKAEIQREAKLSDSHASAQKRKRRSRRKTRK
ncbi:hypothetical protein KFF05_16455 [bacterium SCSIO 12827]|nr:hypothetical protein KFF05_16455 [bacterium SCSIO 12827]